MHIECLYLKASPRTDNEPVLNTRPRRSQYVLSPDSSKADSNEPMDNSYSLSTPDTLIIEECRLVSTPLMEYASSPGYSSFSDMQRQDGGVQDSNLARLDARDLELLTHYLTHTSQTIPYDKADLYALHIGIPNLAFRSKPLMSSMLALAAICQCNDLLPAAKEQCLLPLHEIQSLLKFAEGHHVSSLHQIQKAIGSERYDAVLANATLMTLYGSAVHCVRIRLMDLHKEGRLGAPLPREIVPAHSQWISLIRAVHCAFVGLRADLEFEDNSKSASPSSLPDAERELRVGDVVGEVRCSQDGPAETTMRFFLPVVAATIGGAMEKLRTRVQRAREWEDTSSATTMPNIQACTGALNILESIVAESLPEVGKKNPVTTTQNAHDSFIGRLSRVAPWLRDYTARVTSNSDTLAPDGDNFGRGLSESLVAHARPLRRTITAFLNRVDAGFLGLVQETLERMAVPNVAATGHDPGPESGIAVSRCAMDIFAHWLVLVCLLDGVWWIGDIGRWELGRVVRYMERPDFWEGGEEKEAWWPASMYAIRIELAKQRI